MRVVTRVLTRLCSRSTVLLFAFVEVDVDVFWDSKTFFIILLKLQYLVHAVF